MYRKTSIIVGVLFIIGTVSGVLSGVLTAPLQGTPETLAALPAHKMQWILGTLLILVMGFALAMIPVLLYPVFKQHNEVLALGAVLFRGVLEAVCYLAMVITMLLLLSASRSPDAAALLQSAGEWLNQILALVFSIGALMIYILFYQARIIPRWLSGWGLGGALLYFAAPLLSMFSPQHPALSLESWPGTLMAPLALQEMVFAVWLIAKGFRQPQEHTTKQFILGVTGAQS